MVEASIINKKTGTSLFKIGLSEEKPAFIDNLLLAGDQQQQETDTPRTDDLPQIQIRKRNRVALINEVQLDQPVELQLK